MTIRLPSELEHLQWLVGFEAPRADEDALWRCSRAWQAAAVELRRLPADAAITGDRIAAALGGAASNLGMAFMDGWQPLAGPDGVLGRLADACEQLGLACDRAAVQVEYAKLAFIAALGVLAATLAALAVALVAGGVSALGVPAAIATAQYTIRLVLARLAVAILLGTAANVALGGLGQVIQLIEGVRHGWDADHTVRAAGDGGSHSAARFGAGTTQQWSGLAGLPGAYTPDLVRHGPLSTPDGWWAPDLDLPPASGFDLGLAAAPVAEPSPLNAYGSDLHGNELHGNELHGNELHGNDSYGIGDPGHDPAVSTAGPLLVGRPASVSPVGAGPDRGTAPPAAGPPPTTPVHPPPGPPPPATVPPATPPPATPPGTTPPGTTPPGTTPPGTTPPGTTPPGTVPPGTVPPGTVPPGTVPPGTVPPGTVPPGTVPPGTGTSGPGTSGPGTSGPGTSGPGTSVPGGSASGPLITGPPGQSPASQSPDPGGPAVAVLTPLSTVDQPGAGAGPVPPAVVPVGGARPVTDAEAVALVRQHVFETEAGLGFYARTDDNWIFAHAVPPTEGLVTLDLHGRPGGFRIEDGLLTPAQFAGALRALERAGRISLPAGSGLRLVSGDTGRGGAESPAAALARALGVDVVAPHQPVWTTLDGIEVVSSATLIDGNLRPRLPPDGAWHRFPAAGAESAAPATAGPPGRRW
jgi:hypothetical protein